MFHAQRAALTLVVLLGFWGCTSNPHPAHKITPLEPHVETVAVPATPKPPPPPMPMPAVQTLPVAPTPEPLVPQPAQEPPSNHINMGEWVSLESWSVSHGFDRPQKMGNATNVIYQFKRETDLLGLTVGSRLAVWNGMFFWLGYAPQMINGEPFLDPTDIAKNLSLLHTNSLDFHLPGRIVVIDPGHGGLNSGTHSVLNTNRFEKEFTLDWARRLKPLLEQQGWTVYLTRDHDQELSLTERVQAADSFRADLFISLHFNSAFPKQDAMGIETYCLTPENLPSNLVREGEDDPSQIFLNNHFDDQNFELALRVHRALMQTSGAVDRGVRRARFMGVLRGQNRPAILIEGGYLSNPHEAKLIANPEYREKLAHGVAKALE